jgi:hypothetical protein
MVLQDRRPTFALVLGLNKLFYSEVVRKFITNSVNQGDTVLEVAELENQKYFALIRCQLRDLCCVTYACYSNALKKVLKWEHNVSC